MPTFRSKPVDAVIDVRSKVEFWLGHLDGAVCVPVDQLPDGLAKHAHITKQSKLLVYCASGMRSASAAQILKASGFTNVVDGGGIGDARTDFKP